MLVDSPTAFLFLAQGEFSDIREIVRFPTYWPWVAGAGILLVLLLFATWISRRRKVRTNRPEPIEPPEDKARRLLHALREEGAQLEAEEFTVRVSTILRVYLEEALSVPAPEQTSEEFLQELRGQSWLTPELQTDLKEFMHLADLVKFARQSLDEDQRRRLLDSAVQVVDRTQPKPVSA